MFGLSVLADVTARSSHYYCDNEDYVDRGSFRMVIRQLDRGTDMTSWWNRATKSVFLR